MFLKLAIQAQQVTILQGKEYDWAILENPDANTFTANGELVLEGYKQGRPLDVGDPDFMVGGQAADAQVNNV
jgi:hypothetical protein